MRVRRHRYVNAIVYSDNERLPRPTLLRPVTLVDVFQRHPEWRRRSVLTMRAKRDGVPVPKFPALYVCKKCGRDFERSRQFHRCPKCRRG